MRAPKPTISSYPLSDLWSVNPLFFHAPLFGPDTNSRNRYKLEKTKNSGSNRYETHASTKTSSFPISVQLSCFFFIHHFPQVHGGVPSPPHYQVQNIKTCCKLYSGVPAFHSREASQKEPTEKGEQKRLMVSCPKCVMNNTLDSAFCKKCGAVLPVTMIEEEQEKLKEIVTKGMESYQNGHQDEAFAIADHAILTNPSYAEAYALKGLVLERKGAYAEALDAYETVVALNPDSAMDKIKLNQLRNAFAMRQAGEPKMDRRGAAMMAVGVSVLIIAVSGVVYGISQSSKETKSAAGTNAPVQQNLNPNVATQLNPNTTMVNGNPTGKNPEPGQVPPLVDDKGPIDSGVRTSTNHDRINGRLGTIDPGVVDNSGPGGGTLPNSKPKGNDPTPTNNPKPDQKPPDDPPATPSGGTIEVTYAKPKADPANNNNGIEQANSSSQGKMYQRQGLAYQRSGKPAQARDAFQKAIDAYQKDIASGKGDKDAANAGINSSRQALKNLKD